MTPAAWGRLPEDLDARRLAWAGLVERAASRADRWPALLLDHGAGHVALKALEQVDGQLRRVLSIKANPEPFRGVVSDLYALLSTTWGLLDPEVLSAADDLAELGARAKSGGRWKRDARNRINALQDTLKAAGRQVSADLVGPYSRFLAAAFRLGLDEMTKPIGWSAGFSLADQDALAGLTRSGLYWIGEHYGQALDSDRMFAAVEKMVADGLGRDAGGQLLRDALGAEHRRSDAYWRGLAATVATRSRSFGAVSAMLATGATAYEYVNPQDERTSDVCRKLDGVRFTVRGAAELRTRLLAADSPEAVREITPWPSVEDLEGAGGELLDGAELQAKGIAWPPLHFHCRSSIDVVTWAPITAQALDPQGDVETGTPRPPATAAEAPAPPVPPPPRDRVFGPAPGSLVEGLVNIRPAATRRNAAAVAEAQEVMGRIPLAVQSYAADKGATLEVVEKLTDYWPHLAGQRPRGWPRGSSWDDLKGGATDKGVLAVSGTRGGAGWANVAAHEWGHAMDRLGLEGQAAARRSVRFSHQEWFAAEWRRAARGRTRGTDKITAWVKARHGRYASGSYFHQRPPAGAEEWWAEVIAEAYTPDGRRLLDQHFPGLLDKIADHVTAQWEI